MENLSQSEEWKSLNIVLEAVQVHDSWMIKVKRPGLGNMIRFMASTRVPYGKLDPYDAFVSLCETFAGLPTGDDAYQVWLSGQGLPDTESYRSRFRELVRQRDITANIFGVDFITRVAGLRPLANRKKVLPMAQTGVGPANLNPAPGVPVQTP